MVNAAQCYKKYGEPSQNNPWMVLWDVPTELEIGLIPKKIFCNKDMVGPLTKAFKNVISRGLVGEIKTFDGCFNVRKIRGSSKNMSLHSWGIAIDLNAFANPLGLTQEQCIARGLKPFTDKFVQCFIDAGFFWGGNFKRRKDGMHFELEKI